MNIAIISSIKDKASTNIKENLINNFNFNKLEEKFDDNNIYYNKINNNEIKLYTINSELIYADDLDKKIDSDLLVFISRHSAKEERKCLTAHAPGNFGKNELGGKEKTLCIAPAVYLKKIIKELNKNAEGSDYEISIEATHHGPFLEKPVLFVEIGSSEKEWVDKNAGNIIAKSLVSTIKNSSNESNPIINNNSTNNDNKKINSVKIKNDSNNVINNKSMNKNNDYESVFVIGGGHYNHVANKVMLETNLAVGHICAKYNLESLDEGLIKEAMEKTVPKARFVLLDWKGLGKEKQRILDLLSKNNIEYRRSDRDF